LLIINCMKKDANHESVLRKLRSLASPGNVEGMKRFGISPENALGIPMPELRKMGRQIGRDHALALRLWSSGIHEARILACLVDDPEQVTEEQMESWARGFDSWDVCDQCCMNLFDRTGFAYRKAAEWSARKEEFVKRAGFALMASLSVHDRKAGDRKFEKFLPIIKREAHDERNFVRKAVNWALRQIGKRNPNLNRKAIKLSEGMLETDSRSARWIARDALRELRSSAVQDRLKGG
jgi:3-methyladenine DNA glycosylase AlkD